MDTTSQIKNNLISRIKDSNDIKFLKALQALFDSSEQSLFKLSPEQELAIQSGRAEISEGKYFENDSVISEMREWLTKK